MLSTTKVDVYSKVDKSQFQTTSVNLGSILLDGKEKLEYICLMQARSARDFSSGSLCVTSFPFVLATQVIGELNANGVIGLAPTGGANSFISQLQKHGQLSNDRALVSLNYENSLDTDQKSHIYFGDVNYEEVKGGENGANWYTNLGIGKWSLLMDDFMYGNADITGEGHAMMAIIDSGNSSIQLPQTMFTKIMTEMRKHENSIHTEYADNKQVLVARKSCEYLYDRLESLEFLLQGTVIKIKPRGYLYKLPQ